MVQKWLGHAPLSTTAIDTDAEDYAVAPTLHYQVWLALKAVGKSLTIHFLPFRQSEGLSQT